MKFAKSHLKKKGYSLSNNLDKSDYSLIIEAQFEGNLNECRTYPIAVRSTLFNINGDIIFKESKFTCDLVPIKPIQRRLLLRNQIRRIPVADDICKK